MRDLCRLIRALAKATDRSPHTISRLVTGRLPKRLDLARDAERVRDAVPGLIVANWVEGRR